MELYELDNLGKEQLVAKIACEIRSQGRITFARFMEMALYDPEFGYYVCGRTPVGTSGDFLTSPEMHPAFGGTIAKWLYSVWVEMERPACFDIIEMGAGRGLLSKVILAYAGEIDSEWATAIRYRAIEPGGDDLGSIERTSLDDISVGSIRGCLISNELVDAFPVHLVESKAGKIKEIYVALDGDRFVEIVDEPSTPDLQAYFERLGIELPDGYRTEVNLRALQWIRDVGNRLCSGSKVLTIDYGYTAAEYYSPERSRGTLLCYYRHAYSEDPYVRVGMQDITAHADFTSLMCAGEGVGLCAESFETQHDFLQRLGIQDYLIGSGRRAVMALLDPRGMGGFRVLIQRKSDALQPIQS